MRRVLSTISPAIALLAIVIAYPLGLSAIWLGRYRDDEALALTRIERLLESIRDAKMLEDSRAAWISGHRKSGGIHSAESAGAAAETLRRNIAALLPGLAPEIRLAETQKAPPGAVALRAVRISMAAEASQLEPLLARIESLKPGLLVETLTVRRAGSNPPIPRPRVEDRLELIIGAAILVESKP